MILGQAVANPFTLTFPDVESLAKIMLAPSRLMIINSMTGAGAMSIRSYQDESGVIFVAYTAKYRHYLKSVLSTMTKTEKSSSRTEDCNTVRYFISQSMREMG